MAVLVFFTDSLLDDSVYGQTAPTMHQRSMAGNEEIPGAGNLLI
jgi:hypothetical protein